MTPGDDLDRIKQTLDYVATLQRSHDEQIGKLVEKTDRLAEHSAWIAEIHQNRVKDRENPLR
jgi:hypothetical protein